MNKKGLSTLGKYEKYLNLKGYSKNTINIYKHYASEFILSFDKSALHITVKDCQEYIENYEFTSTSLQNQIYSCIKLFYKHILNIDLSNKIFIERPKKSKQKTFNIRTIEEMQITINSIENIKHKCIVALGYACGLRVSEVLNLCAYDIHSNRMVVNVRNGKGNKDRFVKLPENVLKWLRQYALKYNIKKTDNLFNNYSSSSCNKIVKKFFGNEFYFHLLRHHFISHNVESNVNMSIIKNAAGHQRIETTLAYTHMNNNLIQMSASLV